MPMPEAPDSYATRTNKEGTKITTTNTYTESVCST